MVKNQSCDFSPFMEGEREPPLAAKSFAGFDAQLASVLLLDGLIVM